MFLNGFYPAGGTSPCPCSRCEGTARILSTIGASHVHDLRVWQPSPCALEGKESHPGFDELLDEALCLSDIQKDENAHELRNEM